MRVSEFLMRTENVLLERGWCRNTVESPTGEVCLLGAMDITMREFDLCHPRSLSALIAQNAASYVRDVIGQLHGYKGIINFNDHARRTVDEVIDVVRTARKHALVIEAQHA